MPQKQPKVIKEFVNKEDGMKSQVMDHTRPDGSKWWIVKLIDMDAGESPGNKHYPQDKFKIQKVYQDAKKLVGTAMEKDLKKIAHSLWKQGKKKEAHAVWQASKEKTAYRMKDSDKKVVKAFYDANGKKLSKEVEGSNMSTDGVSLDFNGMGRQQIAKWDGGKVHITGENVGKVSQTIIKYVKKYIPSGLLVASTKKEASKHMEKELKRFVDNWLNKRPVYVVVDCKDADFKSSKISGNISNVAAWLKDHENDACAKGFELVEFTTDRNEARKKGTEV